MLEHMSDENSVKQTTVASRKFEGGRVADLVVRLLEANGTDYVFLHPTSANGPILDAFVDAKSARPILCLHEYVAMSAADGYAAAAGKHGVVVLGDVVGPINGLGGFVNSDENRRPIVVLTSRYPTSVQLKHNHDTRDVAGLARHWTRWDFEIVRNEQVLPVIQQAFQIAVTEPTGPVIIVFSEDHLLKEATGISLSDTSKYSKPAPPQTDRVTRAKVARMLVDAVKPLIITGYLGRNPDAVPKLVRLSETGGFPVVEYHRWGVRPTMNFPMNSPLHLGFGGFKPWPYWVPPIRDADVFLVIDTAIPEFQANATVIHMDVHPTSHAGYPYPADVRIQADSNVELPVLTKEVEELMINDPAIKERSRDRVAHAAEEHERQLKEWNQEMGRHYDDEPISPWRLAHEINLAKDDQTLLGFESGAYSTYEKGIRVNTPGSWIGNPGYFLGWGAGAGIGLGLAGARRKVIVLVGDGAFISGNGVGAVWTAAHYRIPVMWIIDNNRSYATTKKVFLSIAGRGAETRKIIGQDISNPDIDFTSLAKSCQAFAEKVEEPEKLQAALQRGLGAIMSGEPALIDVRTRSYADY
jgi:acetolactate synthase-1/2/3 large subunit